MSAVQRNFRKDGWCHTNGYRERTAIWWRNFSSTEGSLMIKEVIAIQVGSLQGINLGNW